MSLTTQVSSVVTAIGTQFKLVYGKIGTLSSLTTTTKTDLVSAINEVKASVSGAGAVINDTTPSTSTVYSSTKTDAQVTAASTADRARANHTGTQSADTLTDGTTNKAFLATERTKLAGIATGATANSTDAVLEARANHTGTQTASTISDFSTAADARITAAKGVANGVAPLDGTSKIAATYLPAYVDDVLEYANLAAFPGTGTAGLIYVTLDTNKTYRWSGSAYVEISASPGSTDAVTEGTTNLYFTNARAQAANTAGLALKMDKSANLSDVANVATAQTNLGVYSQTQIGDPTTDFVAVFNSALA